MSTIHSSWIKQAKPTRPTRTCAWCKRSFSHGYSHRRFCGARDCERERDRTRRQERAKLTKMLQEADEKRKQRRPEYARMEAEQIAMVEQAFRETREARMLKKADDRQRYERMEGSE